MARQPERGRTLGAFPATGDIWPLVERARRAGDAEARAALNQLLVHYLPPLRAHLVRHKRIDPERAEDLLQSFIAAKVCEQGLIGQADLARGRFRTFLLSALENHIVSVLRHERAAIRHPGSAPVPIDEHVDTLAAPTASAEFDIAWARMVLGDALAAMEKECAAGGRQDLWEVFRERLLLPMLTGAEPTPYEDLCRRHRLASATQAGNLLITAKRMFRRTLEDGIRQYAGEEAAIGREIDELTALLAQARQDD